MFKKIVALATVVSVAMGMISVPGVLGSEEISDFSISASAESQTIYPEAVFNLSGTLKDYSYLVSTDSGYMRVFYNGNHIGIEYYDSSFNITSKRSLDMELDIWGGFYKAADAYYVVEGKNNTEEVDGAEVIRVIKYDFNWNRKGSASITSDAASYKAIRYPFNTANVNMIEYNGTLYIVTGREGYVDPMVGQGHQGFLMIAVDEVSMTGSIVDADLLHSFSQYIVNDGSDLYVLEQSDGSRCTKLSRYDAATYACEKVISVLSYGGKHTSSRAIACYASVDGLAVSAKNVLGIGTSIDQSLYDDVTDDTSHNIYLTVTPKSDMTQEATTVKWLTDFDGDGKCFTNVKLTKINDDRFLVTWGEFRDLYSDSYVAPSIDDTLSANTLHYVFIDGAGNKIGSEYTADAWISDCQPILNGSKAVFYASNGNMIDFYTIDVNNGSFNKRIYRVAGDNATWDLDKNGKLTISGTGKVSVDPSTIVISALSSTQKWFVYGSSDNSWRPIRDKVTSIGFAGSLSEIGDEQFMHFSELSEVTIEEGVTSIGEKAFAYNSNLRKVYIPESVTSIGEDAFWTGRYWLYDESHVVYATIYCYSGSYAETYAKENNINYVLLDAGSVSGTIEYYNKKNGDGVTITITDTNGKKRSADISSDGTFSINKLTDGSYTLTASKSGFVTHTYTVSVKNGSAEKIEVVLKRPGDVSGDGKITAVDSAMVNAYVMKTGTLDSYDQKVADVIGNDGAVTAVDCSRINAHVQKTNLLW